MNSITKNIPIKLNPWGEFGGVKIFNELWSNCLYLFILITIIIPIALNFNLLAEVYTYTLTYFSSIFSQMTTVGNISLNYTPWYNSIIKFFIKIN